MHSRTFVARSRLWRSMRALSTYSALLCFTVLVVLKVDSHTTLSWWWIFVPLWVFHAIVARGRFSLPAPCAQHWVPFHAIIAVPLLVAFEVLLCVYLDILRDEETSTFNLQIVFLPLLILEGVILIDNFRMCKALMPGDEGAMTDETVRETLPHFWVAVSMVFFIAATVFTLLKLDGDVESLGWWDLFVNFGIAEGFAFLVCTKWGNPLIHEEGLPSYRSDRMYSRQQYSASTSRGDNDEVFQDGFCGLENIGGHFMKVPVLLFQILLCMKLEGTPKRAKDIPLAIVFVPVFVIEGLAMVLCCMKLVENLILLIQSNGNNDNVELFPYFSKMEEFCGFLDHGSRLLGWWSIDRPGQGEYAHLWHTDVQGYDTFTGFSPQIVRKMPKKDLVEEVWRLQAALEEQSERMKYHQEEFSRLQNEKVLCRVCFERDIGVVLLPCKHLVLCSICSQKCKSCPVCRIPINEQMLVYDV